jgi:hypothetical protein
MKIKEYLSVDRGREIGGGRGGGRAAPLGGANHSDGPMAPWGSTAGSVVSESVVHRHDASEDSQLSAAVR